MTATPFQALTASDTPMDGMTHQQSDQWLIHHP